MSSRNLLFSLGLFLAGILTASSLAAQAYSFRVLAANPVEQPDAEEDPEAHEEWEPYVALSAFRYNAALQSGVPFDIRVEVLDGNGEIYTPYNGEVRLEIRGNYGEVSGGGPPFFLPYVMVEIEDGVAEPVTIFPQHAGSVNMRIWITDGNIVTDNAAGIRTERVAGRTRFARTEEGLLIADPLGFFSIAPARFELTYVGSNRSLSAHPITNRANVLASVRAVNDNGSTATGYIGGLQLMLNSPAAEDEEGGSMELATPFISFGGINNDVVLPFNDPFLIPGEGFTISAIDGSTGVETEDTAGVFDILEGAGGAAATITETQRLGGNPIEPGRSQIVRYQVNNGTQESIIGPVDVLFRLMSGNSVRLQWVERFEPPEGEDEEGNPILDDEGNPVLIFENGTNSGHLFTSFVLPGNLTAGGYSLQILPGYSIANQATMEFPVTSLPDLAIQQFDYRPGEYRGGDAVRFNLTFANLPSYNSGNTLSSAVPHNTRYRLQIHLSPNSSFGDESSFLVWEESFVGVGSRGAGGRGLLAAGQQVRIDASFLLPDDFDGTYYLLARINAGGDSGRDGSGFAEENSRGTTATWGNNTTFALESQKFTIRPRQAINTYRVSLTDGEGQSTGLSDFPVVSRNGRSVAFESFGALAGNPGSGIRNVFVRNVDGSSTTLVSVAASGTPNGHSGGPAISEDGRYVAFHSNASNLVPSDTNGYSDIFIRDLQQGTTRRISINPQGGSVAASQANHGSQLPTISGDGRFIAFESSATNLVSPIPAGLVAGRTQIYLYDRDVAGTGIFGVSGNTAITLVSQGEGMAGFVPSTNPKISSDGNFVTFVTRATNILSASSPFDQVVRWDRRENTFTVVSSATDGLALGNNISGYPAISGDGSYVAFASRAQNMTQHYDPEQPELGGDRYEQAIPHIFRARIEGGVVTELLRMNASDGSEPGPTLAPGVVPPLGAYEPSLSEDGSLVTFTSESSNLLPPVPVQNLDRTVFPLASVKNYEDDNGAADVYLFDLSDSANPVVRRASVSRFGYGTTASHESAAAIRIIPGPISRRPSISPDGRFITFTSEGKGFNGLIYGQTNWQYLATNNVKDVYVIDLKSGLEIPDDFATVALLMPNSLNVIAGTNLPLVAKPTIRVGSIASVQFYAENELVGTVPAAAMDSWGQFTFNWAVPALAGNPNDVIYDITAIAVDTNGVPSQVSNVSQVIAAAQGGSAPTVSITSPGNGFSLTNRSVWPFSATAIGEDQDISQVEFFIRRANEGGRGISMGIAAAQPDHDVFLLHFDLANLPSHFVPLSRLPSGTYVVTATARDEMGNFGQSAPVSISVTSTSSARPELVGLTASKTEAAIGEAISFSVQVADPVPPMAGVSLYGNGMLLAEMDMATGNVQPGKLWTWEGGLDLAGIWNIYAIGTDANGNRSVSGTIQVAVGRALLRLDVSGTVTLGDAVPLDLEILAGDPIIGWVEFYVNGSFHQTDFNAPYSVTWTPSSHGSHYIEARAWDSEFMEYVNVSATINVVAPPVPPVFSWQGQSSGTGMDLHGVTYLDGRFVAVGEAGTVLTSDGGGWSNRSAPADETLRSVAAGNNVLVAVGDVIDGSGDSRAGSARIIVSTDGSSWSAQSSGTIRRLWGVAYGAGRFVAVGNAGVIRTSDDNGTTWIGRSSTVSSNLLGVVHGTAGFVAVGENGTILTSSDGATWTARTAETTATLHEVSFGNGIYVAVGGRWVSGLNSARLLTSADGVTWSVGGSGIPSIMHGVRFGSGAWVVAGSEGAIASSGDGLAWAADPDSSTTAEILAVAHGGGKFVAVGRGGTIVHSQAGNFETWVSQQFTVEEQGDETICGAFADPEGTGVPNLMRYALGIEDAAGLLERMPQALMVSNPTEPYLALRYVRPKEQKGVAYVVEASADQITWEPVETIGGSIAVEASGTTETVTARDGVTIAAGGERRFLRLSVKRLD